MGPSTSMTPNMPISCCTIISYYSNCCQYLVPSWISIRFLIWNEHPEKESHSEFIGCVGSAVGSREGVTGSKLNIEWEPQKCQDVRIPPEQLLLSLPGSHKSVQRFWRCGTHSSLFGHSILFLLLQKIWDANSNWRLAIPIWLLQLVLSGSVSSIAPISFAALDKAPQDITVLPSYISSPGNHVYNRDRFSFRGRLLPVRNIVRFFYLGTFFSSWHLSVAHDEVDSTKSKEMVDLTHKLASIFDWIWEWYLLEKNYTFGPRVPRESCVKSKYFLAKFIIYVKSYPFITIKIVPFLYHFYNVQCGY
jgi:hypothetical protein